MDMFLRFRATVTVFLLCGLWTPRAKDICSLKLYGNTKRYTKNGDLILGGVFQLFQFSYGNIRQMVPISMICSESSARYLRHFLAVDFAVEEINMNSNILPNVSLGYDIFDSCYYEEAAVEGTMKILSGGNTLYPNYDCHKTNRVVAFIGHLLSSSSQAIASLLKAYGYPQVSYGATDSIFSDKSKFPFFFRTVPNENTRHRATVQLLKHFGWTWVGFVYSADDSNQKAFEEIISLYIKSGGCVAYALKIVQDIQDSKVFLKYLNVILLSSANVIIVYSPLERLLYMVGYLESSELLTGKIWILPYSPTCEHLYLKTFCSVFNGSLIILSYRGVIPEFKEFLYNANPVKYQNRLMKRIWEQFFKCNVPEPNIITINICKDNLSLRELPVWKYDVHNFHLTYSVYIAVYTLAYALHDMYSYYFQNNIPLTYSHPGKLIYYMKEVQFKTTSGDEIFFDANGETPGWLDLLQWVIYPNETTEKLSVGSYHSQNMFPNDRNQWTLNTTMMLPSVCTESCSPGFRKSVPEGQPVCCYNCVPCSEGEISNMTDADSCIKCLEDEWPDVRREKCIPRLIIFLSVQEPLGITIVTCTCILFLNTAGVLVVFTIYRNTPIVKASNRDLSYILLISLMFSFLCTLIFIGPPTALSCLLRQVTFCIIFTVSVSTTLAKNIAVLVAFKATKPDSKIRLLPMHLLPKAIILLSCLSQVLICTLWLVRTPPFPEKETQTEMGKIILHCNEGSVVAFFIALGYIGTLAICSFILAFLVRKLPDRFNEAHYITFSMLCFCSVWVTFIPVYLRTKGKYLVAAEIFAMLSSSAGLLFCIFIPKCHTIILRPELNVKEKIHLKNPQ